MMEQREKENSQNQGHDASDIAEGQSSTGKMAKDFKTTLKYNDTESYASQHHHSIGTGLFLTDSIKDLPPRYRDKVIRALEEGAAVNNIPIEKVPVESLFSVCNDSNQEKKKLDSLVICPSSMQDVSKSVKGKRDNVHTRKEYNAQKNQNPFNGSNSNYISNSTQFSRGAPLNVKNDNPRDSMKDKPHFKSSHNLKKNNRKDIQQKEKAAFQEDFTHASYLLPNSYLSPSELNSEASLSHSKIPPIYSNSVPQKNSCQSETKKISKTPEFRNLKDKYDNSEHRKFHPNSNSSPKHSLSSVVPKSNYKDETKEFNKRTESYNLKEKQEKLESSKFYPNSNSSPKHSLNSVVSKSNYKGETKEFNKRTESYNLKEKHEKLESSKFYPNSNNPQYVSNNKFHPNSNSSPKHSLSSAVSKSNYKGETKEFNKRTESYKVKEKHENLESSKFYSNCDSSQYVSNPNFSKNKFSNSTHNLKQDYHDNSNVTKNFNKTNEFQERKNNNSRRSSSSSHSSFSHQDKDVHYNKDTKMLPSESHESLDFSRDTNKMNFNPGDRSFSHKNLTYRQKGISTEKFWEASKSTQSSLSDCSSQISNTSIKTRSSSTSLSKHSNNNSHYESLNAFDKNFNRSKGNKTLKDRDFPKKQYDQDCLKQDCMEISSKVSYAEGNRSKGNKTLKDRDFPKKQYDQDCLKQDCMEISSKVSYAEGNKNCNSQESNYSKKNRMFNQKPVTYPKKSIQLERNGMKYNISDEQSIVSKNRKSRTNVGGCVEEGFFVKIVVSEKARNLEYWVTDFRSMFTFQFDLERCCHFSDILILEFNRKDEALRALKILWLEKKKGKNSKKPHILDISTLLYRLFKPCNCKQDVIDDSIANVQKHAKTSLMVVDEKIEEIKNMKFEMKKGGSANCNSSTKQEMLKAFLDSKSNFLNVKSSISEKIEQAESLKEIQQLKLSFIRECNAFKRCLPIYSKKEQIMHSVKFYSVSVIIAETGSGKSTQLAEYLLHSDFSNYGRIICTQPRKLAAISIAQFVSAQIGSAVGKIVGYDVGMEQKCSEVTKIIYMTDYCLLKKFLKDPILKEVSCIIIDEAHERSLYTDLVLGMLKTCLESRPDMRVIITSATINPAIFVDYFKIHPESVIEVPGRSFPVNVKWWPVDVGIGWNYVDACVRKVVEIYTRQKDGDILVFLTSASEAEEAIYLLRRLLPSREKKPMLLSLHGKSEIYEQMQVFHTVSRTTRKIIFATNVAETSVTIPGIKYVVDSGMTKDLKFDSKLNKSYLEVTFINKSAAEQRKGRAGRTQSGVCYRMYSKTNYEEMADNGVPEVLKTNLLKALLKIFELGINPRTFNFIEVPPERTISNSVDSLGHLGAIKNDKLTSLGRKIAKLPVEPQLGKLILQGIKADIGYEMIIIAAMVTESSKLFIRNEENRTLADEKKKKFCHEGGDLCTYLEVYRRWKEISGDRFKWCVDNYISSKAMRSASRTVFEIIFSLRNELRIERFSPEFNNSAFKKHYEYILFECFSENLCVSSGHPRLGYLSPYLPESFFIHPSSTLAYLGKDCPEFLVYTTLMETSRNFLFDITPISEDTIKLANQTGSFNLPVHSLKCMQTPPKVLGPFGESMLVRYILGKHGSKIKELEEKIQSLTKVKNAYIDVAVDKGIITVYSAQRFHEKVSKEIYQVLEKGHNEILEEEDVIKFWGTSMFFALTAGGLINDIIMPGEFRELIFINVNPKNVSHLEEILTSYGSVQSISHSRSKNETQISVTFKRVCDAQKAFLELKDKNLYNIASKPYLPNINDCTLPLYILNISWCRCPSNGYGVVEFSSEEDLIVASGILACKSFSFDNRPVIFSPSEPKELEMKNLPIMVNEMDIRRNLKKSLPSDINVKNVIIHRKQSNVDITAAKLQLQNLFNCNVPSTKVVIEMKDCPKDPLWRADVYFQSLQDLENAFLKLKDKTKIDSYPLFVQRVFKSSLNCKTDVYKAFSKQVLAILESKKQEGVCEEYSVKQHNTKYGSTIEFTCYDCNELNKIRQNLKLFLLGESIDLIGTSKYDFLFLDCHKEHIKQIETSTKTYIDLNTIKKVITIYGSYSSCHEAKQKIYSITSNPDFSFTRTYNLRDSCIPAGFLKQLYINYGFDLHGFVEKFGLTVALIDGFGKTLTLKGLSKAIKKAEETLEEMCEQLFKSNGERVTNNEQEFCPICFDPVSYDFQRLELCGHAFCRQCLLLQIESKIIPVVCVKENCGKLIVLEDIKRILSFDGDHLRKTFCIVALQNYVSSNIGKLNYCPTPDCQMIYRVTEEQLEFKCPSCKNSTCSHCHAPYHYGMSCEMFKECQEDEDYSLKTWVKEKEQERKYCPSCKTVIEKASGCNHMECLNCKAHMCWLCLKIFPTGDDVYGHMPFCPKNQGNN